MVVRPTLRMSVEISKGIGMRVSRSGLGSWDLCQVIRRIQRLFILRGWLGAACLDLYSASFCIY